jgi:cysteine desulfurase
MGCDAGRARGSLRFSFGRFNTQEQVDTACAVVPEVIEKLRRLAPTSGPVAMAD